MQDPVLLAAVVDVVLPMPPRRLLRLHGPPTGGLAKRRPIEAPEPPTGGDRLWRVGDVARFLGMSKSWVYQRAAAGLLPYVKIGAALRFNPEAVREWVRRQR